MISKDECTIKLTRVTHDEFLDDRLTFEVRATLSTEGNPDRVFTAKHVIPAGVRRSLQFTEMRADAEKDQLLKQVLAEAVHELTKDANGRSRTRGG